MKDEQIKTAVMIAAAIVIILIIFKIGKGLTDLTGGIFEGLGISDTKEEKTAKAATEKAIKDFAKESAQTSKPTRSAAQWALVADTIYNALKSSAISDDKAKAYGELARVLTDADMGLLLTSFGKRQEYSFGVPIGDSKSLTQFVQDNFNDEDINDLNKLYSKSKMKWKF